MFGSSSLTCPAVLLPVHGAKLKRICQRCNLANKTACNTGVLFGRCKSVMMPYLFPSQTVSAMALPWQSLSLTIIRHKRSHYFCKSLLLPPAAPMCLIFLSTSVSSVASCTHQSNSQDCLCVRALILFIHEKSTLPSLLHGAGCPIVSSSLLFFDSVKRSGPRE